MIIFDFIIFIYFLALFGFIRNSVREGLKIRGNKD